MKYIGERLKEPSTWRGLLMIATVFGANINPEMANAIVTVGASAVGAVGVLAKEKS